MLREPKDTAQEGDVAITTRRKGAEDEQRAVLALLAATKAFTKERGDMPAQYIITFLLVASEPGLSVGDYAQRAGVSKSVMSRHLLDLGLRHRTGEPGLNLIYTKPNLRDLRLHEVYLTEKGHALCHTITSAFRLAT